jgi:RsiW-degrading membrane proteinase PrsW (M82 family)
MTGSRPASAFLRQVHSLDKTNPPITFVLVVPTAVLIGRDPRCQIVLDSQIYGGVSRQHVRLCPSAFSPSGWEICDLDSANGTYINGQRLHGCRFLQHGDRIALAREGVQFLFELPMVEAKSPEGKSLVPTLPSPPSAKLPPPLPDAVTMSQLFPILSTGRDLHHKAYLIPGVMTVAFVVLMFVSIGQSALFNLLLAAYIAGIAYFFVYQLCGKQKPWWMLLSTALASAVLLVSPVLPLFLWVFRGLLPGEIPTAAESLSLPQILLQMLFGAGLMEELLKALPVLMALWLGTQLRSPYREQIGVWEPLDGILLGTASAVGFTLLETLGQYVPGIINDVTLQAGAEYGELLGLQLLIPRLLGSIAGHMAYSGYLGYFIGLSVLKPTQRWQILGIGYFTAAVLHALWNASGMINLLVLALVGVVSYAFLGAAILKARLLSPTRSQNFATRFFRSR